MAQASAGLLVLEREVTAARRWPWWLGLFAVLLMTAAAIVLVHRTPGADQVAGLRHLHEAGLASAALAGLLVLAVGVGILAAIAVGRLVAAGTLARQQKALLDAIVANVPNALVVADGRGRFRANSAAVTLYGFPAESGSLDVYHKTLARLDRRSAASKLRIPMEAGVMAGALAGRSMSMDETITTPGGVRTLHVTGAPIPFVYGPPGGLILASDVTELRATQAALQSANERLAQKNAEHLQMARAIAHDLGNALTPASMHLSILGMGKGNVEKSIQTITRSVDQMHRLVGDLSDLARIESGAMQVAVKRLQLRPAVESAVASVQPMAEQKGIAVTAESAEHEVMADPERVGQVLSNLLSNALKFTASGGTVAVMTVVEGAFVRVSVADTGFGLDSAQIAKLFRPFSQVHDPATVKERGTGIGLYISKGLIERQGGNMGVASPGRGKGSTFWFTLPLAG